MKHQYDFRLAAIKIQSWFRKCLVLKLMHTSKLRYNIYGKAIENEIKLTLRQYDYFNDIDYINLNNEMKLPLFIPFKSILEKKNEIREVDSLEDLNNKNENILDNLNSYHLSMESHDFSIMDLKKEEKWLEKAILERIKVYIILYLYIIYYTHIIAIVSLLCL